MKKGVLILLGMFMMVSTVEAKNGENLSNNIRVHHSYNNSVNFLERGIEFFIFTNGDFDFNSNYNDTYYDFNGVRTRRNGVTIDRDYRGRIRRVGSVFINYDFRGNVSRVGSVYMRYFGNRLTNVGNLNISYNRWGDPVFYGNVRDNFYNHNGIRINLNLGTIWNYNHAYFFNNDFRRNYTQFREDRNFFYYKANRNAKIGKRSQILKRRKQTSVNRNNSNTKRSIKSYRKSEAKRNLDANTRRNSEVRKNSDASTRRNSNTNVRRTTDKNTKRTSVTRNNENAKAPTRIKRTVGANTRKNTNSNVKRTTNNNTKRTSVTRSRENVKIPSRVKRKVDNKKRVNTVSKTKRRS
ncbi:hypothetical protein [uncultured Polaribacter sp.]|uniref:hypothetical protein n=1 Tax=uncultured Polaribacter sp. TaxID=174711 RepID=UPI0026118F48|nr:hypothetical protein [uncultured Polaribacter sp.]